ncbi:MAG: hypothetical protein KGL98_01370 [Gammaproteobacteria bacterium]|nr:hypothetical protein [Gammaproteobacteria bacterium]MBU6510670.1 hypothetical protein [Gammaproteobacteria bacterium]MDE1984268.1 hypothetical protein [Gammaproteobacteria bacterium]MDE2459873.1 hypothetical protein [Gammaproteobacteria bacterium]
MNTPSDDKLDAALRKLPHEIQPARDLWPGIAGRIAARSARNGWSYGVAVAAVVVAAAAVTWSLFRPNTPGTQMLTQATANHGVVNQAVDMLAHFTAQLVSDSNLPPKARAALLDNLRMVNADILQTQAALKKYPNDINLRTLLFNLYQQQARLLNEAQQAQVQTTARTVI